MNSSVRPVQCFVTPELHRALKVQAAKDGTSVSALVRDLMKTYCVLRNAPAANSPQIEDRPWRN